MPGRGVEPIRPPFYAYSGARHLRHAAFDLKDPDGRSAFLAAGPPAPTWWSRASGPAWSTAWASASTRCRAVNPRVILCSTTGFGQDGPRAQWAGHDINYLAVGGYLAATEPGADGGPPVPGATIADAAGGGMQAAMAVMAALVGRGEDGPGAHLDVSIADGVLWLTSLAVDEYLATGAPVGFGHNIITGRYACYDTYRCADGRWVAVGAIEAEVLRQPVPAARAVAQWIGSQIDDAVQDAVRADFAAAFATRDRDSWVAELAAADTCVSPVLTVRRTGRRRAVRRPAGPSSTRDLPGGARADGAPSTFRQVGPVLAGMAGGGRAGRGRRRRRGRTPTSCWPPPGWPPNGSPSCATKGVVA